MITNVNTAEQVTKSLPLMKRLLKTYVAKHWRQFSIATFLMIITALSTGAMAKLMEPIIDKVFTSKNPDMLWPVAISVFTVFIVRGFSTYSYSVIMNRFGQRVISDINNDLFSHLIRADLSFFEKNQSGQLVSRFISDTAVLRAAVIESLLGAGKNVFTIIALISVMFYQDWRLSILSLFVFPSSAYIVNRLGKKMRRVAKNAQERTGDFSAILGQSFQGIKHIKSYATEDYECKRVNTIIENIYALMCKSFRVSAITSPMSEILSGLAIVAIVIYGGYQVIEGTSTAGKLFSFITAFLLAFDPMKQLAKLSTVMQMGLASAERLFNLLDIKPMITDKVGAQHLSSANPSIAFENVTFMYKEGASVVSDVSFNVPAGKTVALVGASGSGKSTVLKLIPRFYDVTDGTIKIHGIDIRDVTLSSLRKNIALVSQEVAIFGDSIKENIAYGSPDASFEQIEDAAKLAAAHEFIMALPQGYETVVGENGMTLSGGQRQRVSIARAILKNAPILLLDEATSALDTTSEKQVQAAIEKLQQGKTTVVVAHRLSTVMNSDVIYVMDAGKIVENGTHAELLAKGGYYSRLYGDFIKEIV